MTRLRNRVSAAAVVVAIALTVGAARVPAAVAAPPSGPALLTAIDVQDMGTFDRVTFHFRTSTCIDSCSTPPVNPLPVVTQAAFVDPPVLADPSGLPVAVAGNAVLRVVMSNASGVDLSVDPPETTYTGPTRIVVNLPNVIEVVETGDFEGVLSWAIGVRSGAGGATAQVLSSPTRVIVDIPHVVTPVVLAPTFTG
jgi:hypothetical protein